LLELVLVIVIIGLLTALLLPVLTQVRETAHISNCASNMRQLWMGMEMYRQDWGSGPTDYPLFVQQLYGAQFSQRPGFFIYDIVGYDPSSRAYVGNERVFFCPDDSSCGPCRLDTNTLSSYMTAAFLALNSPKWPSLPDALQLRHAETPLFMYPVHARLGTRPDRVVVARVGGSVELTALKYPELGPFGF